MNKAELKAIWKKEEEAAHIHGWDFRIFVEGMKRKRICLGIIGR